MRQIVIQQGWENLVYVDESGFDAYTYRPYAWSKRGKKSYGERSGKRGIRTSLIAGKRGKELLAPVLFKGSTNTLWFNQWFKKYLLTCGQVLCELNANSTAILDNAPFHRKEDVFKIVEGAGHKVLFLPPYSPDFNRIEQDFAIIKKRRIYSTPDLSLYEIVKSYGN